LIVCLFAVALAACHAGVVKPVDEPEEREVANIASDDHEPEEAPAEPEGESEASRKERRNTEEATTADVKAVEEPVAVEEPKVAEESELEREGATAIAADELKDDDIEAIVIAEDETENPREKRTLGLLTVGTRLVGAKLAAAGSVAAATVGVVAAAKPLILLGLGKCKYFIYLRVCVCVRA